MPNKKGRTGNGSGVSGSALLRDPFSNKGTAFTEEERASYGLRGLLPPRMLGMDAPEYHYAGATKNNPGKFDAVVATFLQKEGIRY